MNEQLVSIIIPTYNRAYCIARTIDSVLNQSYGACEIIIIDDGSTDNTKSLIKENYRNENRIRYIDQENSGVSGARNHGFREARGEYIALLDSDDVWKPWKLELQVAVLNAFPDVGMVWTDMEAIDKDGNVSDPRYLRTMYHAYKWYENSDLFNDKYRLSDYITDLPSLINDTEVFIGSIYSQMIMGNLVHTSTVLLRRDRLEKVKEFDESLRISGEDYDFHLRTCREGPVAFLNVSSIQYQKEMEDRLTRPDYNIYIAMNYLSTVERAFERDGDRISLPGNMLQQMWTETHQWIGEAALDVGNNKLARQHFGMSMKYKLWQPHTFGLWLLAALPEGITRGVRTFYAFLKKLVSIRLRTSGQS